MNTPEQGYRRTRIATAAMTALGVTVFGGSAALAYLDTHEPASAATVTQNEASTSIPSFGPAPRVTAPSTSSGSIAGSGSTHARTQGS
ncbi:50S ribosomal protein L20 [Rhodococcus sp. AW25M09]|uniref:hypothetical protein n=1 Tax=Rhodococcus sp. AW25M09 TaxID=1268303 RepID=UPI0002AC167C|nr:hypothetical protein [Rhodococcus sp. AW25M09]CCQ13820.1 50S ribosomal protein L20 [Rhodococcus sp. AW25M09]